jgi:hypothetical protein
VTVAVSDSERKKMLALPSGWTWVYAIQQGEDGPIKIGSAKDPDERLATLQCGNPQKLIGVAAWEAPLAHERALHGAFSHLRIRGEWFEPTPVLLKFIYFMDAPYFFEDDMPPEVRECLYG